MTDKDTHTNIIPANRKKPNDILFLQTMFDGDIVNILHYVKRHILHHQHEYLSNTLYLEFGVHKGASLRMFRYWYSEYNVINVDFIGFDSCEGLPDEDISVDPLRSRDWFAGEFKHDLKDYEVSDFQLVRGWFKDTLNDDILPLLRSKPIGLIHIDCDMYSSTMDVLEFMFSHQLIRPGCLLVYDDWGGYADHYHKNAIEIYHEYHEYESGEGRAHAEIMDKYGVEAEFLCKYVVRDPHYQVTIFKVKSIQGIER